MEVTIVIIFRNELVTATKYTINGDGEPTYANFLQVARIPFDSERHDLFFNSSEDCDFSDLMHAQVDAAAENGELLVVTEKNLFMCRRT